MGWQLIFGICWIFHLGIYGIPNRLHVVAAEINNSKENDEPAKESFVSRSNAEAAAIMVDKHINVDLHNSKDHSTEDLLRKGRTSEDSVVNDSITLNGEQSNSSQESDLKDVESQKNNVTKNGRPTKVACLKRNDTENIETTVQVLNTSLLPSSFQTIPNATIVHCVLVLFYAPWCHFSAAAAPHYNALPRLFPDISCIAVNAATYSSLNARYGTVAIPTLLLFHNGQPVAKFNESQYTLDNFAAFVKKYTNLEPNGTAAVTSADFEGPLPSIPSDDTDCLLWISWIFVISCCCYGFVKSSVCHRIVEILRNNWQEAEAQHEHAD